MSNTETQKIPIKLRKKIKMLTIIPIFQYIM